MTIISRGGGRLEALFRVGLAKALKVVFPLHGQELLFRVVAFLAAGDHVALGGPAAAGDRDDVVHGELAWREPAAAVMTYTLGQATFPPLRSPQLAGLVAFPLEIVFLKVDGEKACLVSPFHDPGLHRFLSVTAQVFRLKTEG